MFYNIWSLILLSAISVAGIVPTTSFAQDLDLLALDVHVRDARRSGMVEAAAGGPAWVYFEVENLGAGTVPAGTKFECRIYERGIRRPIVQGSKKIAKPIKGFAKQTVRVNLSGTGTPGKRRIRCTIDPDQKVAESNESNNVIDRDLNLKAFRSYAYRVDLENISILPGYPRSSIFSDLIFYVKNPGGSVPDRQWGKSYPMWQADCQFAGYPTKDITLFNSSQSVHEYPFGDIPPSGESEEIKGEVNFWDDTTLGYDLPKELRMDCTIRVGSFIRKPTTQRYKGLPKPKVTWDAVQVWWQAKKSYQVTNPDSKQIQKTKPELDINLYSISVSASQTTYEAPDRNRNTWVRFTLRADKGTSKVQVQCIVEKDSAVIKTSSASKAIFPTGPGSTTMEGKGAINMGQLSAGRYSVSCVADPDEIFRKDTARGNNKKQRNFDVQ